jgi:hypothetical protein
MDAAIQQLAYVGGIAALVIFAIGIVCIAFAERGPKLEDDEVTPEAPFLPPPVIKHLSVSDRIEWKSRATPEEQAQFRAALRDVRDRETIDRMIRDVGGC